MLIVSWPIRCEMKELKITAKPQLGLLMTWHANCWNVYCFVTNKSSLCFKNVLKCTVAQKGQSQISFPKHKSIFQNTNQFTKTQINFLKHKPIFQNTNQFTKTQINFSKHKSFSSKHKSKDRALALLLSDGLERTHSQDFPRPIWRLVTCCKCSKMFCSTVRLKCYRNIFTAHNVEQSQTLLCHLFDNCCPPEM